VTSRRPAQIFFKRNQLESAFDKERGVVAREYVMQRAAIQRVLPPRRGRETRSATSECEAVY